MPAPFHLTARPLAGGLWGRTSFQSSSLVADPARLMSALVHAAGQGECAVEDDRGELQIAPKSIAALEWLENNPPETLMIPNILHETSQTTTFRDTGGVLKNRPYRSEQTLTPIQAVDGSFGWRWPDVPREIAQTLMDLAQDIAYLGQADSRVVFERGRYVPTHALDLDAGRFSASSGLYLRIPLPGRLAALRQAHDRAQKLTRQGERFSMSQTQPAGLPYVSAGLTNVFYREIHAAHVDLPWTRGWALPILGPHTPDANAHVALAVGVHRALIHRIGDGCPSSITGIYPEGVRQPANHVSIQTIAHRSLANEQLRPGAVFIMCPPTMSQMDEEILEQAVMGLHHVTWRGGRLSLGDAVAVDCGAVWNGAEPGLERRWRTSLAWMPETRRPSRRHPWSVLDAFRVSVAHVWRDYLDEPQEGGGYRRLRELAQMAQRHGVELGGAKVIPDTELGRYAHRPRADVNCVYRLNRIDLGDLSSPHALVALGQSRHLGAGLLLPQDVPSQGVL